MRNVGGENDFTGGLLHYRNSGRRRLYPIHHLCGIGVAVKLVLATQINGRQRVQNSNWPFETLCTDNDFRAFHRRVGDDWENFNDDEKYRAHWLGMRNLRPLLDELVAYYDALSR